MQMGINVVYHMKNRKIRYFLNTFVRKGEWGRGFDYMLLILAPSDLLAYGLFIFDKVYS